MNRCSLAAVVWMSALLLPMQGIYLSISAPVVAQQPASQSPEQLQKLAQSITVKIIAGEKGGSGILLKKAGSLFTVLTSQHVLEPGKTPVIQTSDGQKHQAELVSGVNFGKTDLVLLQFRANGNYTIASQGNASTAKIGDEVFAAGFPFEDNSTKSRQFVFKPGRVSLLLEQNLQGGYRIGYTSDVEKGMSGGPILNFQGQLIGINGIHAQPLWGNPFIYENGSEPNDTLRERMRRASWGVSIETLAQIAPQFASANTSQVSASKPTNHSLPSVASHVDDIAKEITVLISWPTSYGSGVIVAHEGDTYYILTAGHVIRGKNALKVVTPDGQEHPVNIRTVKTWDATDLGLLQFTSNQNYPVAILSNYNLTGIDNRDNKVVFVSGWPESKQTGSKPIRRFSPGYLFGIATEHAKDARSLSAGYELVYTNVTDKGMSGSPVLDSAGRVIGIHAATEGEPDLILQTSGSVREIQFGNSLGVPIRTFLALVQRDKIGLNFKQENSLPAGLSDPQADEIINSTLNLQPLGNSADEFEWLSFGNKLLRALKYERAVEAFDRAIKIKPDFALAWYARGRTLKLQKKYKESLISLKKATAYRPEYDQAWREQSDTLFYLKRFPEASLALEKAIELKPDELIAYQWLSEVQTALGNYLKAIQYSDKAINLSKSNPIPYLYIQRGRIERNLGDQQEAIKYYNEALRLQPDNTLAYSLRAASRSANGDLKTALSDVNEAIRLDPDNAEAYVVRGIVYFRMGNRHASTQDFDKALRLQPDSDSIYSERGDFRLEIKDYKGAIADYIEAIRLAPESAYAYYNLIGNVHFREKDYKEAIAAYTESLHLEPNYAQAYVNRGFVYANLGKKQEFTVDFNKALQLQPDNAQFYRDRGSAQFTLKDNQSGIEDYNKAIKLAPQVAHFYYKELGDVRYDQKDYPGAIADYTEAIRLKPDFSLAFEARGSTRYGKTKDYPGAIADYTEAIRFKPENALLYKYRAFAYYEHEDWNKAMADLNAAIRLKPDLKDAYVGRGLVSEKLKDKQGAVQNFQKAAQLALEEKDADDYKQIQSHIRLIQQQQY